MKKIIAIFLTVLSSIVYADCSDGYRRCVSECGGVSSFYDYQKSKYVYASETDFAVKCEDSCRRGKRYCESESNLSNGCDEFKRKCRNECPTSLYSYKTNNYIDSSDANSKCEDSCNSGYRRCQ